MHKLVLLIVALIVVPPALAGSVRSVSATATVTLLAMDGRRVAFAEAASSRDCHRVRVWNLQTRAVMKLGRTTACVNTSTGTGIASLALAGNRVLWLHYTGGNIREWRLFTATTTARRPRLVRMVSRDVDGRAPIVVGDGNSSRFGDLLPYAVDRDVAVLKADGSRRFSWRAPARVTALSALFGKLAVATEGGTVTVLDASGKPVRSEEFSDEVAGVKLSGDGILVQRGRTLEVRRGGESRTFQLPAGARLEDALGDRAFYVTGGQARQLSLRGGAQRMIAVGSHIQAELSTVTVSSGRRVTAEQLP